jgi:hypothetical protein
VNHVFRLVDSPAFKDAFDLSGADVGLLVSDRLYSDVVGHGGYVDPGGYRPMRVVCKETEAQAWLWLPPSPACDLPLG